MAPLCPALSPSWAHLPLGWALLAPALSLWWLCPPTPCPCVPRGGGRHSSRFPAPPPAFLSHVAPFPSQICHPGAGAGSWPCRLLPQVTQGSCRGTAVTSCHRGAFEVLFAPRNSGVGLDFLSGCSSVVLGCSAEPGQALLAVPIPAVPMLAVPVPPSARPGSVHPSIQLFPVLTVSFPRGSVSAFVPSVGPNPAVSVPVSACASPGHSCPSVLALPVRVSFRASPPTLPGLGLALLVLVRLSLSCFSWCPSASSLCAHPGWLMVPVPLSRLVLSWLSPAHPWVTHPCPHPHP